jgi:hypothetical protein
MLIPDPVERQVARLLFICCVYVTSALALWFFSNWRRDSVLSGRPGPTHVTLQHPRLLLIQPRTGCSCSRPPSPSRPDTCEHLRTLCLCLPSPSDTEQKLHLTSAVKAASFPQLHSRKLLELSRPARTAGGNSDCSVVNRGIN